VHLHKQLRREQVPNIITTKCVYTYIEPNHYLSLKDPKHVSKLHWRERVSPTITWVWKTRSKWANYIEERECPQPLLEFERHEASEQITLKRERECPQPAHYVGPWLVQGYPKGFHSRESRTEGIVAFWAPSTYRGTFGSSLKSCPCCWRCQTNRVCTQLYGHSKWTRQMPTKIQFLISCMCHTINVILVSSSGCNSTSKNPILFSIF
jgi:hypothetical protein